MEKYIIFTLNFFDRCLALETVSCEFGYHGIHNAWSILYSLTILNLHIYELRTRFYTLMTLISNFILWVLTQAANWSQIYLFRLCCITNHSKISSLMQYAFIAHNSVGCNLVWNQLGSYAGLAWSYSRGHSNLSKNVSFTDLAFMPTVNWCSSISSRLDWASCMIVSGQHMKDSKSRTTTLKFRSNITSLLHFTGQSHKTSLSQKDRCDD